MIKDFFKKVFDKNLQRIWINNHAYMNLKRNQYTCTLLEKLMNIKNMESMYM